MVVIIVQSLLSKVKENTFLKNNEPISNVRYINVITNQTDNSKELQQCKAFRILKEDHIHLPTCNPTHPHIQPNRWLNGSENRKPEWSGASTWKEYGSISRKHTRAPSSTATLVLMMRVFPLLSVYAATAYLFLLKN